MNKANRIAVAQAQVIVKRSVRAIRLIMVAGLSAIVLAACGGGAQTTDNPVTSITPTSTYNGPPPQTADVQAFKLSVWDNIQASNRCGGCHVPGGIGTGSFARNDDINIAYQEANMGIRANLTVPSDSEMVTKLNKGHNCWLTDNAACADIMTT